MPNTDPITARSLLLKFFELRRLSPEYGDWTEERLADNPPRLIRLRQLIVLFRAFDITWNPHTLVEGAFIDPENRRYDALYSRLASEVKYPLDRADRGRLIGLFTIIFKYRLQLDNTLSFYNGVLEASGLYSYALEKTDELNTIILDNLKIIDDILVELIDPEAREFVLDDLINKFGYPDVDLFEIDSDWY